MSHARNLATAMEEWARTERESAVADFRRNEAAIKVRQMLDSLRNQEKTGDGR